MTRAKSKTKASRFIKALLWINVVLIFFLVLTYATPYISVDRWGWFSLLALAYPFILLANGIYALGWIFFRKWYALFSILALLAGIHLHKRYIQIIPSSGPGTCPE